MAIDYPESVVSFPIFLVILQLDFHAVGARLKKSLCNGKRESDDIFGKACIDALSLAVSELRTL